MKIDRELITKVSGLAHLNLNETEIEKFEKEFKSILDYFEIIKEVNIEGVESSFRPVEQRNALREDEPGKTISQEEALMSTCNKENGFFIGPKTVKK